MTGFRTATRDDMIVLLNPNTWHCTFFSDELVARRDAALVALVAMCGLQGSEPRILNVGDWRPGGRNVLSVPADLSPGGDARRRDVPLLETAVFVIGRYLEIHPAGRNPNAPLVVTRNGGRMRGSDVSFQKHTAAGRRIGLGCPGISLFRILRASFETWVRSAGVTDGTEQMLLGLTTRHVNLEGPTPSPERLRKVLESVHPLAKPDRRMWTGPGAPPPTRCRATHPKKLDGHEAFLRNLLEEQPYLTMDDIRRRLSSDANVFVRPETIARHLKRHEIGR